MSRERDESPSRRTIPRFQEVRLGDDGERLARRIVNDELSLRPPENNDVMKASGPRFDEGEWRAALLQAVLNEPGIAADRFSLPTAAAQRADQVVAADAVRAAIDEAGKA